ncbi:MAG: hypothetical protein ACR2G5_07765 [Pyrinomonadaceae bacterium]
MKVEAIRKSVIDPAVESYHLVFAYVSRGHWLRDMLRGGIPGNEFGRAKVDSSLEQ